MAAVDKIDFKENKEKICGRPLYCKVMKNLTPTKEKATAKENEENEDKQEPTKNDETVDKHTANKIVAKPKPKLLNKTAGKQDNKTPSRLKGIEKFLSPGPPGHYLQTYF